MLTPDELRAMLPAAGLTLLNDVDQLYGASLHIEIVNNSNSTQKYFGECGILPGGVPFVRVSPLAADPVTTFMHELSHLKLRFDGFPVTMCLRHLDFANASQLTRPEFVEGEVRTDVIGRVANTLQHFIFFPHLQAQGYNPYAQMNTTVSEIVFDDSLATFLRESGHQERMAMALQCLVDVNDQDLQKKVSRRLNKDEWEAARYVVNKMWVRTISSPEHFTSLVAAAAEHFWRGKKRFTPTDIVQKQFSDRYTERIPVICIE